MTRLAVTAVAAIYAFSLAGLATVLRAPEPPRSQAYGQSAITLTATAGGPACRAGDELDALTGRVVVDVDGTA